MKYTHQTRQNALDNMNIYIYCICLCIEDDMCIYNILYYIRYIIYEMYRYIHTYTAFHEIYT